MAHAGQTITGKVYLVAGKDFKQFDAEKIVATVECNLEFKAKDFADIQ